MTTRNAELRNIAVCVAICMVVLIATWPFSPLPFNDDFTWAETVRQLQLTGHLKYNGWSSPPLIAQAYWGLGWVKLFGFSFNVLRVSSLPLAAGAVAMCYLLARRTGLTAGLSVFITLTLGLSPIFMPLACTFMTDVPGLFFALLSMYALLRGMQTPATRLALNWIIFGAVVGLIGGSSRQVVWIVPLVMLPYGAWLRREQRLFPIVALALLMVVFAGAICTQRWFALQPYSIPDPPLSAYVHAAIGHPGHLARGMLFVALTTALLLLPAGMPLFRQWKMWSVLVFLTVVLFLWNPRPSLHLVPPWIGNILSPTGVMGSIALAGDRPILIPLLLRDAGSVFAIGMIALLLCRAWVNLHRSGSAAGNQLWHYFFDPPIQSTVANPTLNTAMPALLLTSVALLGLELTRAMFDVAFDRHLLPLIPFLGIPLLMMFQKTGRHSPAATAWLVLMIFTIISAGLTQEVNALARARAVGIARLEFTGVKDFQIDAGLEHDYRVQIALGGFINDARLSNPPGAYNPDKGPTPGMHVIYRLESGPSSVTRLTHFGSVNYFSMLPPFHRRIFIDEFVEPWWNDPVKAATRPVEKQLLPPSLLEQYRR